MGRKSLKKVLSGLGIAALVAGTQTMAQTAVVAGSASGCSSKKTETVGSEEKAAPIDASEEKGSVLPMEEKSIDKTGEEAAPQQTHGKSG